MRFIKISLAVFSVIVAIALWCAAAVLLGLYGWWMRPIAPEHDAAAFFAQAERRIDEENPGNTAFLLVENGDVFSALFAKPERGVDGETVFPTASFSKWVTALGVMALVEEGRIELDAPVSTYLDRWNLPDGPYDENGVTIRRLLSHMAGLTDALGFGDYAADEELPTLEQTLNDPRASSDRPVEIAVGAEPGEAFAYSGGGYLILQLLIEEATSQDYQNYIEETILEPLDMRQSSFDFIGDILGATRSFDADGVAAPQYQYAAAGATGFASSATDLLKLAKAVMAEDPALGLSPINLKSMRRPEATVFGSGVWGLGVMLYAPTGDGDFVYGHDGANDPAINVSVRINPENNDAIILLVNGHPSLASDIGSEWVLWQTGVPDFLSTERALKSALAPGAVGAALILLAALFVGRRAFSGPRS